MYLHFGAFRRLRDWALGALRVVPFERRGVAAETEGVLDVWKTEAMIAQAAREVPLQRLGRPEEVAWAVIFLASDRANFITGETRYVSGGPRVSNRED